MRNPNSDITPEFLPPHKHAPSARYWAGRVAMPSGAVISILLTRLLTDPNVPQTAGSFLKVTALSVLAAFAYSFLTWRIAIWATPICPHSTMSQDVHEPSGT